MSDDCAAPQQAVPVPLPEIESPEALAPADAGQPPERLAGRKNLLLLIQLRWLAVAGQLVTIVAVEFLLSARLPMGPMFGLLGALALFNGFCELRRRFAPGAGTWELFGGLVVDVLVLSWQLYFSGGITNPFIYLYLLQIAVAAVLLRPAFSWAIVALSGLCFDALTRWHLPLYLPDSTRLELSAHYVGGLLVCFALNAALLVVFIGRISRNLRQRDASLADLRQRAVEEEHIVRMGLLASGAAHELGTPLATMAVILGDWARMPAFSREPELQAEIKEMQAQLGRCKSIVTGILRSAGDARGDAPTQTSLAAFLDDLVAQWCRTRSVAALPYRRENLPALRIISDTALRQMIGNVLDNALEAAPDQLPTLTARCDDALLRISVQDRGPGFHPDILARFGKPYQSTKSRQGGGLGLFLAVNVARSLGGNIVARQREQGGAEVLISLPLSSLTPRDPAVHDR